jgi:hypothetical protein
MQVQVLPPHQSVDSVDSAEAGWMAEENYYQDPRSEIPKSVGAANGAGFVAVGAALHAFSPPPPQLKYAAICFAVGLLLFVVMHFLHAMVL